MCNIPISESSWSRSDWMAIFALAISILSIIFSYFTIFISKKVEVRMLRYTKLGVENTEAILMPLDEIFKNNDLISNQRTAITDTVIELQTFLIALKKIYPKIDITQIINISNDFSDIFYEPNNQNLNIQSFNLEFVSFKLRIFDKLYNYAITKELNFFTKSLY